MIGQIALPQPAVISISLHSGVYADRLSQAFLLSSASLQRTRAPHGAPETTKPCALPLVGQVQGHGHDHPFQLTHT